MATADAARHGVAGKPRLDGRIDKWLFRSNAALTLTPLTWHFEIDVLQDAMGLPLSDHDALAVRLQWQLTSPP